MQVKSYILGLVSLWGLVVLGMATVITGLIRDDTGLIIAGGFITTFSSMAMGILSGSKE